MKDETFRMWGDGQNSDLDWTDPGSNPDCAMGLLGDPGHNVTSLSPDFLTPVKWGLPPPLSQSREESMK